MPALQLDVVHVGSAQTIRIAPRSGNMSFSHHPSKNEIQCGRSRLLHAATIECYISKFPQKMRRFISKSFGKDCSQPYFIFICIFNGLVKSSERRKIPKFPA